MQNQIRGDKNNLLKALWEQKTENLIVKQVARNRIADIKKRAQSDLNARRVKLAALLASEDKIYEQEFLANLETPEQVRAKMAARLDELNEKRRLEKEQHVQRAIDRKFKMETDDLRREETHFMTACTQLEREKQLMDKRNKMEEQIVEEQVYAKLWMLDAEKKLAREKREAQERKEKVADTMNVLGWQTQARAV